MKGRTVFHFLTFMGMGILAIVIFMSSCSMVSEGSRQVVSSEVIFGDDGSRRTGGSAAWNDDNVTVVHVRAFTQSGVHLPDNNTGNAAVLVRNESANRWEGTISLDLTGVSEPVILHAMAFYATGEIVYQGTEEEISNFGSGPRTLPVHTGYAVGNRGPGGGWVMYVKGEFSNDSSMGKSWRYLEAAPHDLVKDWNSGDDALKIDENSSIVNGNVVQTSDPAQVEIWHYEWYYGPAGSYSTVSSVALGKSNTDNLSVDGISSATPKKVKARGRKAVTETASIRRDTAQNLDLTTPTSFTDWFIPSSGDLEQLHTARRAAGKTLANWNLTADTYWSSTEDTDGQPADTSNTDYETTLIDMYWAWAVQFAEDSAVSSLTHRSEANRVRPVRAF